MKTKKIFLIQSLFCLLLLPSCEKDNFTGPTACFYGSIRDVKTGELVETDLQNGATIEAYELGYENPSAQTWVIKNNGEFRNNLVFSNKYDLYLRNANFYPLEFKSFEIKPGNNEYNFEVEPYIRIKSPTITHNQNEIVATFSLEGGRENTIIKNIRLYAFSDMHVGEAVKFDIQSSNDKTNNINEIIDPSKQYELSINLEKNTNLFKAGRSYYFRIGAIASLDDVGTVRHNYAPAVKISF